MKQISIIAILSLVVGACGVEDISLSAENGVVDISKAIDGDWDKVCILTPYTPVERGAKITGLSPSEISKTGIELSDSFNTLVLLKGSEKFAIYNVSRKPVDLAHIKAGCFAKSEAKFKIA